jgi:hypothetical protein
MSKLKKKQYQTGEVIINSEAAKKGPRVRNEK